MESWIFLHLPLEQWIERWISNYKNIFDAWEDGGVRGLAVGRMRFGQEDGSSIRPYAPDPKVYEGFGVSPPPQGPRDPAREKVLHEILENAAARGWRVMFFDVPAGGGGRPPEEDPYGEAWFAATAQDLMNAYPEAHGIIMDCPGEQHYELAFHNSGELLEIRDNAQENFSLLGFDLRSGERARYALLGFDLDRMERGIAHLRQRFQNLTPDLVRYHAPGGSLGGLTLFDINEDALYWLRARQQTALEAISSLRRAIDRLDGRVELGGIPRTAAFASLTAQNYQQMAPYFDYIFPKHYYWLGGIDGLYGTVQRWVLKLAEWNPALTEEDCFALLKSLFGLELPGVHAFADLHLGFPDEFFSELVYNETRRALEAIKDVDKVICWVSTGRKPHGGEAMTARDLHGILQASKEAGLKRFLFHPDPELGAPEWHVLSGMCGNPWQENPDHYWPTDTWREDIEGYPFRKLRK